jgi:hypothetical protein
LRNCESEDRTGDIEARHDTSWDEKIEKIEKTEKVRRKVQRNFNTVRYGLRSITREPNVQLEKSSRISRQRS